MSGTKKTMRSRKPARKRPAMPTVQTESLPRQRAMLRTCASDMTSYGGFRWPEAGAVEAPDWNPEPVCGGGLHGLLDGCGDGSRLSWDESAKWLVVEVDEWVEIDNAKVKAPRGRVVYVGERGGAIAVGVERYGWDESRCVGGQATAGYRGQATAGDYGQATAGYRGQATAGYRGQATAGYRGQATAGDYGQATAGDYGQATAGDYGQATAGYRGQATAGYRGQATAGDYGQATAGYRGQATAGYRGQATAGDYGQATAGDYGQATAGDYGQATAGYRGQATAGYRGQATAGDYGTLAIRWYDGKRYRIATFYVGEDGIKANVAYRVNERGEAVRVEPAP